MGHHKSFLNVAYWNANGIQNKIHQLYLFMQENFIDVMCICETFLKSKDKLHSHPLYSHYRADRPDERSKGGVLILAKRSLSHQVLPIIPTRLVENVGLEVDCGPSKIQIYSCYLPGGTPVQQIRSFYNSDLTLITRRQPCYYALGDFNSKHRLWNCARANPAGGILFEKLNRSNFKILYPFEHTHHPADPAKSPSTIDIGLTNSRFEVLNLATHPLGSDHNIVTFRLALDGERRFSPQYTRPCYKMANWELYRSMIEADLVHFDFDHSNITATEQVEELVQRLTSIIDKARNKAVPMTVPDQYALSLTPVIKEKIKIKSVLERQWQRSPNEQLRRSLKTEINQLKEEIDREIFVLRNINWAHRLRSLTDDDHRKSLWQLTKFVKKGGLQIPPLKVNNQLKTTPKEKSEVLASTFAAAHINPLDLDDPEFTASVEAEVNQFLEAPAATENVQLPSIQDTEEIIRRLKTSKSPGLDDINYAYKEATEEWTFAYSPNHHCLD